MMKLIGIIIGLAVFSGILAGLTGFFFALGSNYGVTNINNLTVLDRANQTAQFVQSTQGNLTSSQSGLTTIFTSVGLLWSTITQMLTLPATMIGLVTDINSILPFALPVWFIVMISTVVTIVIIFKIVSWFTGRDT